MTTEHSGSPGSSERTSASEETVVQQDQQAPADRGGAEQLGPFLQVRGDLGFRDAQGAQESVEHFRGVRAPAGGAAQVRVELSALEERPDGVGHVHGERALAHARHAADDRDGRGRGGTVALPHPGQEGGGLVDDGLPAGEVGDVRRELGRCGDAGCGGGPGRGSGPGCDGMPERDGRRRLFRLGTAGRAPVGLGQDGLLVAFVQHAPRGLGQQRLVERPELLARFEAEVVDHAAPQHLVDLERLVAPAGAVEGDHQGGVHVLVERTAEHERLELADQLLVASQLEVGLDPQVEGALAELLEPRHVRGQQAARHDVDQRGAAPEREGPAERLGRPGRVSVLQERLSLTGFRFESVEVDGPVGNGQGVPPGPGEENFLRIPRGENFPEFVDVCLQRGHRTCGRITLPQFVDKFRGLYQGISPHEEKGYHLARLGCGGHYIARTIENLQRAEHPEVHLTSPVQ